MKRLRFIRTVVVILSLAGIISVIPGTAARADDGSAAPSVSDKSYNPVVKYALNDMIRYRMVMKLNLSMGSVAGEDILPSRQMSETTAMNILLKTIGVKPDGTYVISERFSNGVITMGGKKQTLPAMPPLTMDIDQNGIGKIHEMGKISTDKVVAQMMNLNQVPTMGVLLPGHPISVGDVWSNDVPIPFGKAKAHVQSEFLGVETINGAETMKIRQSFAMPMDMMIGKDGKPTDDPTVAVMSMSGNMRSSGVINILEDNARIVRSNADLDGDIQMNIKGHEDNPGPEINIKETGNVVMYLLGSGNVNSAVKKK